MEHDALSADQEFVSCHGDEEIGNIFSIERDSLSNKAFNIRLILLTFADKYD